MTGRQPNTDRIAIENSGVSLGSRNEILVNEYLQTNVEHIFAVAEALKIVAISRFRDPEKLSCCAE